MMRPVFFHRGWHQLCWLIALVILLVFSASCLATVASTTSDTNAGEETAVKLPEPRHDGQVSLEKSLFERRSVRSYSGKPLTLLEVSQLLWAAQGITSPEGLRTAPSAGALYPLELYAVVGNIEGLPAGVYRYIPDSHQLVRKMDGDRRKALAGAALGQTSVLDGALSFVFTAVYERTTGKYGERGTRYVHMEVGHAAQNLCLQAVALGLGAVTVGAFSDAEVSQLLDLSREELPLYIIPVGRR